MGYLGSGLQNTGVGGTGLEAGLANSAHYATGGLGTAALSSGLLSSALANTGGLHSGLAGALNSGLSSTPVVAPASAPAAAIDAGQGSVSANPTSSAAANAGLRTSASTPVTGFVNPGSSDPGVRTTLGRESGIGALSLPNSGIPKSNFYPPADRDTGDQSRIIQFPIRTE